MTRRISDAKFKMAKARKTMPQAVTDLSIPRKSHRPVRDESWWPTAELLRIAAEAVSQGRGR